MAQEAYIVAAARTPVGRAGRGSLRDTRPDELAALALVSALLRAGIDQASAAHWLEDVILGCATPEGEQGLNVARIASLRAGLPVSTAAMTVNRFCASGLEALALADARVRSGAPLALGGGVESMSRVAMGGHQPAPNPWLLEQYPDAYLSMGLTAERLAQETGIGREAADAFALESHRRALAAIAAGHFQDEIVPVETRLAAAPGEPLYDVADGWKPVKLLQDECPRAETTAAALAALPPAFGPRGQVTAGNASQMSDGAAALLVANEAIARQLGLRPLGQLRSYAVAGIEPARMGLGPVAAIPRALERAGLQLADMEVIELNEAFAVQALAVIMQAGLDGSRVNVNGGAIALGHPLGCTGARLAISLLYELRRRRARYGLVTMCIGGGMGAAAVIENLQR